MKRGGICRQRNKLTEKMANGATLIFVITIVLHVVVAKYVIKTKIDSISYDEIMEYANATNITNDIIDEKNYTEVTSATTVIDINVNDDLNTSDIHFNHKKCELLNVTADVATYETKQLASTYLNNMFTGETMKLIHDNVSIDNLEADGENLFDLVKSNCGSAKICHNVRGNRNDTNTITIGFLSAYGWSQVKFSIFSIYMS